MYHFVQNYMLFWSVTKGSLVGLYDILCRPHPAAIQLVNNENRPIIKRYSFLLSVVHPHQHMKVSKTDDYDAHTVGLNDYRIKNVNETLPSHNTSQYRPILFIKKFYIFILIMYLSHGSSYLICHDDISLWTTCFCFRVLQFRDLHFHVLHFQRPRFLHSILLNQ